MDLVLSSGFLAFARHAGFLRAVERLDLPVEGVCGTSSGALTGALWAAGLPAERVLAELTAERPVSAVRLHARVWRGALSLRELIRRLREWLPPTFEGLPRPFGVGVVGPGRAHRVIHEGPLPEAVAASCAIPYLFCPVELDGVPYADGGFAERAPLDAWRALRGDVALAVHMVEKTHGAESPAEIDAGAVVRSPPSGASFFDLGDVDGQFEETRRRAEPILAALG